MAVEGNGQRLRFNRIESDECNEQRLKKNVGVEGGAGTSYIISFSPAFVVPTMTLSLYYGLFNSFICS